MDRIKIGLQAAILIVAIVLLMVVSVCFGMVGDAWPGWSGSSNAIVVQPEFQATPAAITDELTQ